MENTIDIRKQAKLKSKIKKYITVALLLLPLFSLLLIFKYYSFAYSIVISFFDWNGMGKMRFVGFENYITMVNDPVFWESTKNLVLVVVVNCLKMLVMSFIAAELVLNVKSKRISNFFKYMFIIPIIIPNMVTTLLWQWVYDYKGILNMFLDWIGLGEYATAYLSGGNALLAILMIGLPWVAGIPFLVMLSGLQSISYSLFEMAEMEGCSYLKRLWKIDLPLIVGQIKYVLITTIISSMQFFEPIQVLTNGGPGTSTMTPAMYMYRSAFGNYKFGYSASIGTVVFILVMIVTVINLKLLNKDVSED